VSEPVVYFAFTGGERVGPLSYAELDGLAANGKLQPEDLVWQSGTADWVPASRFVAFVPKAPPRAPSEPLPPRPGPPLPPPTPKERVRSLLDDLASF
jgi:hypothetical protein